MMSRMELMEKEDKVEELSEEEEEEKMKDEELLLHYPIAVVVQCEVL